MYPGPSGGTDWRFAWWAPYFIISHSDNRSPAGSRGHLGTASSGTRPLGGWLAAALEAGRRVCKVQKWRTLLAAPKHVAQKCSRSLLPDCCMCALWELASCLLRSICEPLLSVPVLLGGSATEGACTVCPRVDRSTMSPWQIQTNPFLHSYTFLLPCSHERPLKYFRTCSP